MKPAAFEYHAPESIDDVVGLLAEHGDEAKPLAGGQSLVPMLALRLARFEHVVDLNRVPALAGIERADGTVAVGAMTRQAELERSDAAAAAPLLGLAAPLIGHFQIRNRGTVGGSIAHADPAGELPTVALALDAELDVTSTGGTRTVAASELFAGTWETTLAPEELLTRVRFPVWPGRSGFAVEEVARRYGDFALAGVACGVELDKDGGVGARRYRAPRARQHAVAGERGRGRDRRSGAVRRRSHRDRAACDRGRRPADRHPCVGGVPGRGRRARRDAGPRSRAGESGRVNELPVSFVANGVPYRVFVEPRKTLADCLREDCGLTGTHLGCEHGVCGACTVLVDGVAVRSCLMFAVQAEGAEVTTVEGLAADGELGPVQRAFRDEHGLQCGFCTPGFVVTAHAYLAEHPDPTRDEILEALSGNLCRCTGYQGIVRAVERAAASMRDGIT